MVGIGAATVETTVEEAVAEEGATQAEDEALADEDGATQAEEEEASTDEEGATQADDEASAVVVGATQVEEGVSEVLGATQVEEGVSEVLGATQVEVGSGVDEVWGASYRFKTGQRSTNRYPLRYVRKWREQEPGPIRQSPSSSARSCQHCHRATRGLFDLPGRHRPTGRQSG